MKFKSNTFAYYGVTFMHLFIPALWLVLLIFVPIRNRDDLEGFVFSLLAVELLFFSCSPIAHRIVVFDEKNVTEKWMCFVFNKIEIANIADIGVCTYLSGNQIRQFVFISTDAMSDEEVIQWDSMSILHRKQHKGRFISTEYPQKGLDECMTSIAAKNHLNYRQFSI